MTNATFQRESYGAVIDEIKPLLERHWLEIARNRDVIEFAPDYGRYEMMDLAGACMIATVRVEGALAGYAIYFMTPHLHYRNNMWAISDIIWLAPEYRRGRLGVQLIEFAERTLRELGVSVMHTTGKVANPVLAAVLEHLGHIHIEFAYAKLLQPGNAAQAVKESQ